MLRDRGKIKWTALMLPEHVERLRAWQAEDTMRMRTEPDEQQLEEWNYLLAEAMETNELVVLTHWQTGRPQTEELHVHCLEPERSRLRGVTAEGKACIISLCDIETVFKIG
ncbi:MULTISPECIES: YolD-like family protein [Sporosarcina]|uniref:YolD-like family protein n=1 Tax=Sporosarcina TaxID=1569 RepID=UPI00058E344C|nr:MULTISPECIES: YolD-like family protein [Sporosarcina]WJY28314.1 YolD-like family protein [Sporosarcina sp. 0.2-SM1T-5]